MIDHLLNGIDIVVNNFISMYLWDDEMAYEVFHILINESALSKNKPFLGRNEKQNATEDTFQRA